jgi:hypothetical protein
MNIPTGCRHREQSLAFLGIVSDFESTAVCDGVYSRVEV